MEMDPLVRNQNVPGDPALGLTIHQTPHISHIWCKGLQLNQYIEIRAIKATGIMVAENGEGRPAWKRLITSP